MSASHLLLIGGGHAHVAVLADWIRRGLPCKRATLLTPYPTLRYSGMVPGWISGQYERDAGLVDLAGLAARAGVALVLDRCTGLDPDANLALTESGDSIGFDIASIDTGGVGRAMRVLGYDPRLLDIRPIDEFVARLDRLEPSGRIAVVGGGAGGVELAFALRNRGTPELQFITGLHDLVPNFSQSVRRSVIRELRRQGVEVITADARLDDGGLHAGETSIEPVDLIVAALGSAAPDWPRLSGLACDSDGFIAVDQFQRSTSHPHILAVGDVAARQDRTVPHSGVHAVMAGPALAANLRALGSCEPPSRSYRPRRYSLYLLSTGDGRAIASYGPFSAKGRWVRWLKHWIDTRWIEKYARLAQGV